MEGRKIFSGRPSVATLLGGMIALQALWLAAKIALTQLGDSSGVIVANPKSNPFGVQGPALTLMGVGIFLVVMCPKSVFRRLDSLVWSVCRRPWHTATVICALTVLVAVIPALTFPIGGDEKALYDAGSILAEQGWSDFLRRYPQTSGVGDRHPMLVPLLAGIGQLVFGDNPFGSRLIFFWFLSGSAFTTYLIGRAIYDELLGFCAAIFFVSIRLTLFMGIRVSTDLPVTFFALLSILFTIRFRKNNTILGAFGVVVTATLGMTSKYTMGMIFPLLAYIMTRDRKRPIWPYIVGGSSLFVVLIGGWGGLLYTTGALEEQIRTVGSHLGWNEGNVNLLSSWRMKFRLKALLIQIPSALGAYALPLLAIGVREAVSRWSSNERFLAVWIGTIFLFLLATLPVDRYFIPSFPGLAIVGALGLRSMGESAWRLLTLALLFSMGTALLYV